MYNFWTKPMLLAMYWISLNIFFLKNNFIEYMLDFQHIFNCNPTTYISKYYYIDFNTYLPAFNNDEADYHNNTKEAHTH